MSWFLDEYAKQWAEAPLSPLAMIGSKFLAADGTSVLLSNKAFNLLLINLVPTGQEQFVVFPFILF